MVRKYKGYFAARACQRKLEVLESALEDSMEDPITEYYGAQDVVGDSYLRSLRGLLRSYGFRNEQAYVNALVQ